jgi:2-keto-4-pentenoate hydratase/2-oxohepta-3-ene-1,7-dioic acid hydratase in catechol pathway
MAPDSISASSAIREGRCSVAPVRLATFADPETAEPHAGEVRGETVVTFDSDETVLARLASGDLTPADGAEHALADVTLLAPVPRPRAIFGIGLNYAAHARETGSELPEFPIVFMKLPTSSAAPGGEVTVPEACWRRLDYEGELAVVMGAHGVIAGYAIADDLSARDLQGREPQWTRAKGFDNSCPWGPWITTADEVADPRALELTTHVNGSERQRSPTSDLVFGPEELVGFISETITLEPGDLILTGTPDGVGVAMDPRQFLERGDVIRIEITGLGAIEHTVR